MPALAPQPVAGTPTGLRWPPTAENTYCLRESYSGDWAPATPAVSSQSAANVSETSAHWYSVEWTEKLCGETQPLNAALIVMHPPLDARDLRGSPTFRSLGCLSNGDLRYMGVDQPASPQLLDLAGNVLGGSPPPVTWVLFAKLLPHREEQRPETGTCSLLGQKVLALRSLEAGWLNGEGEKLDSDQLELIASRLVKCYPAALPMPAVFPTEDGNLLLEWDVPSYPSLDINLTDLSGEFHAFGPNRENIEQTFDLSSSAGYTEFVDFLAAHLS